VRVRGGIVGLAVGLLFVPLALNGPFSSTIVAPFASASAVLAAASIGGWIMGRAASSERPLRGWLGVIGGLAVTVEVIGAMLNGVLIAASRASSSATGPLASAVLAIGVGVWYGFVGVLLAGIFVLPISLAGAVIWAAAMALLRDRDQDAAAVR